MNYDVLKLENSSTTIKAEACKIVSHKKSNIQKNGFRRFESNKVIQTSRLGEATLDQLMHESKQYGGLGTDYNFGFSPAASTHKTAPHLDDSALRSYSDILEYLKNKYPDFIFSGECSVSNKNISLKSSYGLDLSTSGGFLEWYFLYQRKGSGNMLDGYIFGFGEADNILKSVNEQELYLNVSNKVSSLKSGAYPVLFVEEKPVLKKLLESFHVNKYKEGAALYAGKLGQKLFDSKIDLVDCGYDHSSGNFMFFDGEGTIRTDDLLLIKEGIFNSLISDLRNQKKYDFKSSGNGTRLYNRGVNLDFKGIRFKKRSQPWLEIIKNLPICIVALVAAGGDSNDLGEYSTAVQVGYVFKNGELEGLAPQITVKTSIDNYLGKKLIDVSSDGFIKSMPSPCIISEMDVLVM